jgi:hypothetical protein
LPDPAHDPAAGRLAALRQFAARRTAISVVTATLGTLTDAEREYFRRQLGLMELKAGVRTGKPVSTADRVAKHMSERQMVDRVPCADPARRERLEADPVAWLKHYMAGTYSRPFERPHTEIVAGVMRAHETQGRFVVAAERGIGKSAILWGMILFLSLSNRQRYPVCVPWADKALKRAFRFWKNALCFNDALGEDYPEYCAPFRHSRGVPQRVAMTTWRDTGMQTGAQLTVGEGMIVLPDRLGAIGGSTINGNIRGLNHPQDDGTVLRPSIALLDDVQDRQTAKSPIQVADTCAIIDGDVGGCGDPGRDMPMLMACNCIAPGDVSEHYLAHPEWHALRVPCVLSWPVGWDDQKAATRKLWSQWHDLFLSGKGDRTFYRKHKRAMTAGMKLSAPAAFTGAERCPDPFYGVMRMYFRMGHESFMAERQQAPVDPVAEAQVRVTPDMIVKRAIGPARGVAPDGTIRIVAGADINPGISGRLGARITWACAAVQMHQSACVIAYGIHRLDMPKDPTPSQQVTCVYGGLNQIRMALAGIGCELVVYDARGWYNNGVTRGQALRYAAVPFPSCTCAVVPAEGWPHRAYKPTHKTAVRVLEGCHEAQSREENQRVRWVAWNSDWFNLQQLRAWMAAPGAPGSCIIYSGHHEAEFLNQCTTRAFCGMKQSHSGPEYDWARTPGHDDYGDCLAMCRVGAAYYGIGTGGQIEQRAQRKRYSQKDLTR